MNQLLFCCKRAYLSTLAVTRRPLAYLGLTAARFDMLHEISRGACFGTMQSDLRRALGVSAPTVSRMLRSLEKLGLVTRKREDLIDKRQRWIKLTALGRKCFRRARKWLIGSGAIQLVVDCVLRKDQAHCPEACFAAMCYAEDFLLGLRLGFGDTAKLILYPWHPDD